MYSNKPIFKGNLERNKKYKIFLGKPILIVYGHSPLRINITGLNSMQEIENTRKYIEDLYEVKCSDVRVDNIFYSHKDSKNIDMNAMYYHLRDQYKNDYVIDYNIELFPGLYMKSKIKGLPTLILFRTGSFTIIGCKSIEMVTKYKSFIYNIFNYFYK